MLKLKSPAKINIGLHIISKRPDGYHNIETIFYPIQLYDYLTFENSDVFQIETNNPLIPADESNLIYKAKKVLEAHTGIEFNLKVKLEKRIPVFAGLGGGSSNAAITLKAINDIFELNLTTEELIHIASKVGSDVPFFILMEPAFGEGKGEILTPLKNFYLEFQTLIIYPNVKISTVWAYENFKKSTKQIELSEIKTANDFLRVKNLITNDFETIVFEHYPEMRIIKENLIKSGAIFASLSGSGSAVYAFFEKEFEINKVKEKFNQYQTFVC